MARHFHLAVLMLLLSPQVNAAGRPTGWQAFSPAPKVKPTHFAQECNAGRLRVRADADQSMSSLIACCTSISPRRRCCHGNGAFPGWRRA